MASLPIRLKLVGSLHMLTISCSGRPIATEFLTLPDQVCLSF